MTAANPNQRLFDHWAPRYERGRISRWFQHYQQRVLDRAAELGGGDLLDVGCGTGWLVRTACTRFAGRRVTGVDFSPGMLAAAREKAHHEGHAHLEFVEGDAAHLPFRPASFDFITCTASFHHYPDPLRVLHGWRRTLRPGGRFLLLESCTTFAPIWVYDKVLRLFERGHVQYYRTRDLIALGQRAAFDGVRAVWCERGVLVRGKLFSSLALIEGVAPTSCRAGDARGTSRPGA